MDGWNPNVKLRPMFATLAKSKMSTSVTKVTLKMFFSPVCFDFWESILKLLLVFCSQCVEALQLGGAVLGFENQFLSPAHEARCVVPAVNQAQLRLLWVDAFL